MDLLQDGAEYDSYGNRKTHAYGTGLSDRRSNLPRGYDRYQEAAQQQRPQQQPYQPQRQQQQRQAQPYNYKRPVEQQAPRRRVDAKLKAVRFLTNAIIISPVLRLWQNSYWPVLATYFPVLA